MRQSTLVAFVVAFVVAAAGLQPSMLHRAPSRPACSALLRCASASSRPLWCSGPLCRTRSICAMELLPDDADAPRPKGFGKVKQPAGKSKQPAAKPAGGQKKPKTKTDRFEVQFTCNVCEGANAHSISRHAYTKGTVIVTCPHCKAAHLIADNLNWIENDFRNLEEFMEKRGTPVSRVVTDSTAVAATAAAVSRAAQAPAKSGSRAEGGGEEIDRLDGITEDMALRIRKAVRDRKRRKAEEAAAEAGPEAQ